MRAEGDSPIMDFAFPKASSPAPRESVTTITGPLASTDRQPPIPVQSKYRPIDAVLAIAPTISVVIPVKNEARNLPIVFRSLPGWIDEVVLVDGRSVDDTVAVANECCPDIKIVHQVGSGKGDALRAGFAACTSDIIVMIDGDGSTDGAEIVRFVAALVAGADFAKGSRFSSGGSSDDINLSRRLGNRVLCGLVNMAFGTRYTDLCYGYNAFWSRHLPVLGLDCLGFEIETMMNIRAARAGLCIQEVPSHEYQRVHGVSNLRIVLDGWRILKVITAEAFRSRLRRSKNGKAAQLLETDLALPAVAIAADVSKD
jgi:glycosyltransferase involved in cell wall biosynthesis